MTPIQGALYISLISIVVLFGACLVIWGLMALLTKIPGKQEEPGEEVLESAEDALTLAEGAAGSEQIDQRKKRAAAAAVAVALALQKTKLVIPTIDGDETAFSAWKAVQRASSMSLRNGIYTRKPRG